MSDKKKLLVVIDPGHTGNTYNAGAVSGEVSQKQAQNGHLEYPKVTSLHSAAVGFTGKGTDIRILLQ